jgi:transcriptional regulator
MPDKKPDLLQGTLDLLILRTLALEPMHGFAIAKRIEQVSSELLRVEHGSLYPALYRLEEQGFIAPEWGVSENNRKVKYYKLTRSGQRQLERELQNWRRVSSGIERVIAGSEA